MNPSLRAPLPAGGTYSEGFEPVARVFAEHLRSGAEIGAGLTIHHRGRCVVDLYGGLADVERGIPWRRDTRVVVFSVTKGLAAMALMLLDDRGRLDWDAPVSAYWKGFGRAGKEAITVRTLFNHRGGLAGLDMPLSMEDCLREDARPKVLEALESQRPLWRPEHGQGYHAITFGMYARELFERIAGESMGAFLERELFVPLDSDARLGTPAPYDERAATLYPPATPVRVGNMLLVTLRGDSTEARVTRATLARESIARKAFSNPRLGRDGLREYDSVPVRRAELAWASATSSARGLSRAYLPFASAGLAGGRRHLRAQTLAPVYARQGWSDCDSVLQKPLGWSQGFLKEETTTFSPNPESFGHAGMGGALGWADPVCELAFGYVMNKMDWHVRSPRALALCHALYACEPVRETMPRR